MWPLQLTYSPQLLAKYIQSQNINPTNKCFPIVGRINTITIYIYNSISTYSPNVYICIEYILATIICCICVLVYFVKPYLWLQGPNFPGAQFAAPTFSRGPICRQGAQFAGAQFATNKFSGAQFAAPKIFRGPICRGPNLPGPNLPGPNLPQNSLGAQFARGPICLEPLTFCVFTFMW